ncbi:MAG: XRE family transcriptional regulator [Verrucomicrobiota bacterium]
MPKTSTTTPHKEEMPMASQSSSPAARMGDRIRRARLMAGLSLRGLADALDGEPSHTQIAKFEAGEICPDSKQLARFSRVLKVRPDYFFKKDELKLETVEYRSQAKLGLKNRKRLEEQAYEFFERYLEIERILGMEIEPLGSEDLSGHAVEDLPAAIEKAAHQLRVDWELGMNPIPNVHVMLETHGLKVKTLAHEDGFDGFSAFATSGDTRVPVIALSKRWIEGPEKDLPRFRFTAIHELAHLYLKLPDALGHKEKEGWCHWFAGAFLIPREPFAERFGVNRVKISLNELMAIKREWGMSIAAIMKRACNLGLVTPGRYKTYCIVANTKRWNQNEPGDWFGEEQSSRFEPLVLRALAQELITPSKAAGLLGISLPELGSRYTPLD